jgi:hypothetical protein
VHTNLQAYLKIQALKYNHGMLCVITNHKALKYQNGDWQLIMRADALKMRARQLIHQAADPSKGVWPALTKDSCLLSIFAFEKSATVNHMSSCPHAAALLIGFVVSGPLFKF